MKRELFQMIVLAGVTAASSVVLANESTGRVVVPTPPPTSRPSEADLSDVADTQKLVDNARNNAVAARADLVKAYVERNRIARSLQTQLDADGALTKAANEVEAARSTYLELAQPILASLIERSPYCEAHAALAQSQQAAAAVCARADAAPEERFSAAQAVLDAKATMGRLENAALDDIPDVVNARTNYLEAANHLKEMRLQLRQAICRHPAYVAASQAVDDAGERSADADLQLAIARKHLFASQRRLAEKALARQETGGDWTYRHDLPEPPPGP